jgi:hypothetical protein
MAMHLPRKVSPINSIRLSMADVVTIYERLSLQLAEQAQREINGLKKNDNQTEAEFGTFKANAREKAFKVTVTIAGRAGESLYGEDVSVFSSPNKPDKIAFVYMTNVTAYQGFAGVRPVNAFELNLDFSKPPLMDANNPVSAPTKNLSSLTVQGDRDSWVAAISDAVLGIVDKRKTNRGWLHRAFAYDVGLWCLAFPFAFLLCWRAAPFIAAHLQPVHSFVAAAGYMYVFVIAVWAYRALFGYTKWAFPTVELSDNRDASIRHRAIWGAIILGLVANVLSAILWR